MRKRFPLILGIILIMAALIFVIAGFSMSGPVAVSRTVTVKINPQAALRKITDTSVWRKWWPNIEGPDSGMYVFENVRFGPPEFFYNSVVLKTYDGILKTNSRIIIIPAAVDSVLLSWSDSIPATKSFMAGWKARGRAAVRGRQIEHILSALGHYLDQPENIYGFRIFHEISKDSTLISVDFQTPDSPGTVLIYQKLDALKAYIAGKHTSIVNYPMIHIEGKAGAYKTMLAYPVNKALPNFGQFKFKRFLPWKMISAEVRGGELTVRAGYHQFYQYIQDYGISVMANGFAFLVTDRRQEPDSSKWVTRFSAPIP